MVKRFITISVLTVWFYLCMCVIVSAQTDIYRSVQPGNTSAIATNSIGTLTISGSTATFSAALPDSVGVGCVIQYDKNNDATVDNLAFIHGRTSSTVFTVKDSLGAAPDAVTGDDAWSIYHAYTTLSDWESGAENNGINVTLRNFDPGNRNLVTNNEKWHVCLYRGTLSTATQTAIDWVTGTRLANTENRIIIYTPRESNEVGTTQGHQGLFSGGFRYINTNTGIVNVISTAFSANCANLEIDGIVVSRGNINTANTGSCIKLQGTNANSIWTVKNCIVQGKSGGNGDDFGVYLGSNSNGEQAKVFNNYFFRFTSGSGLGIGIYISSSGTMWAYNNSIYSSSDYGIRKDGGGVGHIKNNVASNATADYNGTFSTTQYNASSDATASGTGSRINQTFSFTDAANGDLSLTVSDTAAADRGEDLSLDANLAIPDDMIGTTRPQDSPAVTGNAYDMGAFEFQPSGGPRRWLVQSILPEIFLKYYLYVLIIILVVGTGLGIYRHFFCERKIT